MGSDKIRVASKPLWRIYIYICFYFLTQDIPNFRLFFFTLLNAKSCVFASLFLNAFWRSDAFVWNASDAFFLNLFLNLLFSSVGQRQTFLPTCPDSFGGSGYLSIFQPWGGDGSERNLIGIQEFPYGWENHGTTPCIAFQPLGWSCPGFSVNLGHPIPPPPKKKRYPTSILWFVFFWPLGSHEFRSRYIRYIFHDIIFLPNSEQIFRKIFQGFLLPSICPLRLFFLPLWGKGKSSDWSCAPTFGSMAPDSCVRGVFRVESRRGKSAMTGALALKALNPHVRNRMRHRPWNDG